jgi:FkbM family methyltransferase
MIASFRTVLERMSRHVVLRRRLPSRFGGRLLYVSPDVALRFWRRGLETADASLFDAVYENVLPGHVVWDVGANLGLFAFAAAGLAGEAGRVVAIEPDPFLVALLRRSARRRTAGQARVEVVPAAVSESSGLRQLCIAVRGRSSNYIEGAGGSQAGGVRERQWIPAVTLDSLLDVFPAPNLLKVDVEGHELAVLSGGRRLLAEYRPTVLCEIGEEAAGSLTSLFKQLGYQLFDADILRARRTPLARAVWNTLAVPPKPAASRRG